MEGPLSAPDPKGPLEIKSLTGSKVEGATHGLTARTGIRKDCMEEEGHLI